MLTDKQEAKSRYEICKNCIDYRKIIDQCKVCGCIMSLKTKISSSTCPKGKWGNNGWEI